jgi:hypothetical protein
MLVNVVAVNIVPGAVLRAHGRVQIAEHVPLSKDCPLEVADAFVVALAARRSWFCYHQVFAVLPRFERRRTGLAELAALGWGRFLGRALAGAEAPGHVAFVSASRRDATGRPLGARRIGLAAYTACSSCGRLADAGPIG